MKFPIRTSTCFTFLCVGILVLLFGCTEDEEKEFNEILQKAIVEGVKQEVGLGGGSENASGPTKPKGECRFDSDCAAVCEGEVYWKRGCDPQTDKCVKTFETDCNAEKTTLGTYSFAKLCTQSGCVEDTDAIRAKKDELVDKANEYTTNMLRTTELRQIASRNCINGLAEVTNKLIIETAISFSSLPTSMVAIYSDTTKQAIDTIGSAATGSTKMSAEEFISLNCNAVKALDTDYALLAKKRDMIIKEAKPFEGR